MSILDDALNLYSEKMRREMEAANKAVMDEFKADFGDEPDGAVAGCVILGDLYLDKTPGKGKGSWYASVVCKTCGDRFGDTLHLEPTKESPLLTLGRAAFACASWKVDHVCVPSVDYAEVRRALEYAAGKAENGSSCDAEMAFRLATAMILEGILKKLAGG